VHTVVEPVPETVKAILHEVFRRSEVEPRINCACVSQLANPLVAGHIHSWMMLSNRITENRRLDTAAPAIRTRMITRSSARVFGPEACLRNAFPSVAAIMGVVGQGKKTLRKAASEALRSSMLTRSLDVRRNDSPTAKTRTCHYPSLPWSFPLALPSLLRTPLHFFPSLVPRSTVSCDLPNQEGSGSMRIHFQKQAPHVVTRHSQDNLLRNEFGK
jgi:hypothetical protein